jgi:predicted membrane channel-forming protein YqfA (hemolysin III family)
MKRVDGIDYVLLVSRWLHLGSAIVAIGGAVFMRYALMPAASATLDDATHERLREAVRKRWAMFVHAGITILLLTGALNFLLLALPPKIKPMPYHAIFGVKFLAAMGVFFIAGVLVSRGQGLAKMRAERAKWLTVLIALGAFIVLVSGVLNQVRTRQMQARSVAPATSISP